jgi:hypothetical protein
MGRSEDREDRAHRGVDLALLLALGLLVPAAITALGGALGIARNDDFAFAGALRTLVDQQQVVITGPNRMTLVGQLVLTWPVGLVSTSPAALQGATLVAGLVGLVATRSAAGSAFDRRTSRIVALAVVATPLWIPLVGSYMTDVWTFALVAVAFALVARAASATGRRQHLVLASGALLAAVWAAMVRQSALAALVAVIAVLLRSPGEHPEEGGGTPPGGIEGRRSTAIGLCAAAVVAFAGLYAWRSSMALASVDVQDLDLRRITLPLRGADRLLVSLSLALLPATLALVPARSVALRAAAHRRTAALLAAGIGALSLVHVWRRSWDEVALQDHTSRFGAAAILGPPELIPVLPLVLWLLLLLAAMVDLWVLAVLALTHRRAPGERASMPAVVAASAWFVPGYLLLVAVGWVTGGAAFDRYVLVIVPWCVVLLAWTLRAGERPPVTAPSGSEGSRGGQAAIDRGRARALAVAGLLLLAWWMGLASARFDAATWTAAERAAARTGVAPRDVHGGLAWNGAQAEGSLTTGDDAGGDGAAGADPGEAPAAADRCVAVRQATSASQVEGELVLHDRLLWVDRWFSVLEVGPEGCPPR